MPAICEVCTTKDNEVAFPTVKELFNHKKGGHKDFATAIKKEEPKEEPKPEPVKPKPIVLKYKYEGSCNNGHELDTILIPVGEQEMAVAYCPIDREQITSRKVIPIDKQNFIPKK